MSEDGSDGEDLDKLLNDWDDLDKGKQEANKSKPKLAATSKRRPGLQRHPSNSEEEGDDLDPAEVKPRSLTSDLPKSPLKKPSLGVSNVPLTALPKTNPNANLLGNAPFSAAKDEGPTKKPFLKGPALKPSSAKPITSAPSKVDSDWLGIGSDSPQISANTTPIPQRKDPKTASTVPDFFDLGTTPAMNTRPTEPKAEPTFFDKLKLKQPITAEIPPPQTQPAQTKPKPVEKPAPTDFADSGLPSFLDKLTTKGPPQDEATAGGDGAGVRKKVVTVRKAPSGTVAGQQATLQVPSHVIDEEELKRMFQCQKQLYDGQVTMLEQAYKDQIQCVTQSFARKEEMLKEEIKMVQKDYDDRIGRLKAELVEAELRPVQFRTQNAEYFHLLSKLSDQLNQVQLQHTSDTQNTSEATIDLVAQKVDSKLAGFLNSLESSLTQRLENPKKQPGSDQRMLERLDSIYNQLESQAEVQRQLVQNSTKNNEKTGKALEEIVMKVMKEQKKMRETLIKSTVTSMTQAMEAKHEDQRRKDKLSLQIRESRREIQRLFSDFELKHESLQKSQRQMEGEQKHIFQSFHDLSTWLHMNITNGGALGNFNNQSATNEMEMKLLKDERSAMSESIAKINVEKRRLQDERIQIEAERREIERQRSQIQDLETTLRIKISDADETKKQIEVSNTENKKLSLELSRKMTELEKERVEYREKMQGLDLTMGLEKQRQAEERTEIIREREFLEKLRLQFLCPGCLRLVRSQGDGLDSSTSIRNQSHITNYSTEVQEPARLSAHLDLERKGQEVKTMIANYYGDI